MKQVNLKGIQAKPFFVGRELVYLKPGDTNLSVLSRAAGYKLRGKGSTPGAGKKK